VIGEETKKELPDKDKIIDISDDPEAQYEHFLQARKGLETLL